MLYHLPDDVLSARPVTPAQPQSYIEPILQTESSALPSKPRTLLTVQKFSAKHDSWSPGALRNLIFHAQPRESSRGPITGNGLAPAIVRLGRKVLIDEAKFFEWLDNQQHGKA